MHPSPNSQSSFSAVTLPADDLAFVSIEVVEAVAGYKTSAIYARAKARTFPAPLRLSYKCSRWRAGDIRRWLKDPHGWTPALAMDAGVLA